MDLKKSFHGKKGSRLAFLHRFLCVNNILGLNGEGIEFERDFNFISVRRLIFYLHFILF